MIRHVEQAFPGCPEAISDARAFVRQALAGLPAGLVDDAVLCASELATNAVRYSTGEFVVVAEIGEGRLQVQVVDQGGPEPMILPSQAGTAEGRRGLPIITALGALYVDGDASGHRVSAVLPLTCLEVTR